VIALGVATAGLLGVIQLASMAAFGDLAQPPAVPSVLPGASLGAAGVPAVARAAYAQALVHRGADAAAAAIVATLPDGVESADLRGQLAELQGRPIDAERAYVRAGDFERAQRLIDARVDAGLPAEAARDERALLAALTGVGRAGVRARALWRLGQISQIEAQAEPARRVELERASLGLYDAALALAPNEETYLLAAGQQALTLGDRARAASYYARALGAVPDSADARDGLARSRS
jgi:tetratricopeptide (TPR) repeat protein